MENSLLEKMATGRLTSARLDTITPHTRYDVYSELLSLTEYGMTSCTCMTPFAISTCLTIHPIVVIKPKGKATDRYICVAGLRSLLLAKAILGVDAEVPLILRERPRDDVIELMVSADLLFSHLLFSVKKPESLGRIFTMVPPEHLKVLLAENARSKPGFAAQTSYVYNTLFPKKA